MAAIIDNTVLSNFAVVNRQDVLETVFRKELYTTEEVISEYMMGVNKKYLPLVNWDWITQFNLATEQEKRDYDIYHRQLGSGEAMCLSLAHHRGLNFLTDDLKARKLSRRIGVSVSGTIGVLMLTTVRGILTLREANFILQNMIARGYYAPCKNLKELP